MPNAPWAQPNGLNHVLSGWLASSRVKPCLVGDSTSPSQGAAFAPFPPDLDPSLKSALEARAINSLYTHQAAAFSAASRAENFVVSTPTASGKSLCFHLPVLQTLLADPDARAIYMFPTKALSRDQEASLRELLALTPREQAISAVVYDGDTPADARRVARERGGVIMTNPDMLHTGILPHHTQWARTFQNLRYVVLDELHTYKGVFGSHVANVLRRLQRVARFHGSNPQFIGATATIGNPREHAERIFGNTDRALTLIDQSGAPRGTRRFFLYNPPVVNSELGIRASYVKQAVSLGADLARAGVPTMIFGHSRNSVETMLRYWREAVARDIDPSRIVAYRGGYLPAERRDIEQRLREGNILGVVATSALELGIDIGDLDAVICAGYPGSVASMWQRFGRAGRRGELSICVLVASSAPLDQYLAREPAFLLGSPIEEARIDADNVEIVVQHLKCAAFELPFKHGERFGSLPPAETVEALRFLAHNNVLHEAGDTFHWAADAYPANSVSLRSVGWSNVVIIDVEKDKAFAEIDWRGAHTMVHDNAIYQHNGECWQVEKFDYENHKAFVRQVKPDYFTDAMTYVQVSVIHKNDEAPVARSSWASGWGDISLVEKVVGYKKIKFFTHENAGYGDVFLPEMQLHTTGFWLSVPEAQCDSMYGGRAAAIDALRGIGIALETVATLQLMCDPRDLGATLGQAELDEVGGGVLPTKVRGGVRKGYDPTLFLYEHTPGGIGLAERIFELRNELLERAERLVATCPCQSGCPACVGPGEMNGITSRKSTALKLLSAA